MFIWQLRKLYILQKNLATVRRRTAKQARVWLALPLLLLALFFVLSSPLAHAAAVSTTQSGNWSDPGVWSSGQVPGTGDAVVIGAGHTVVYDLLSDTALGEVTILGTLYVSRQADTRLRTGDHIEVQRGGYLNMGTPDDFIPADVRSEVIWTLTQEQADSYGGGMDHSGHDKGLWVMDGGRWDVHGAPLVRTWSKLAGDAPAGAATVDVANRVQDWTVGGTVVLPSTRNPLAYYVRESDGNEMTRFHNETEVRTIVKVEELDGGSRVTLDQPLDFDHSGQAPLQGEVALLTRNVLFMTEIQGADESGYEDVRTRKFAHTLYLAGAEGDLAYAEFKQMGHYGKLGRYPVHYHMMQESSHGMVARGLGVWRTGFRCINLHISHGVLVEDNVCYDASSTAFFVEPDAAGVAQDHAFVHNLAVDVQPKHFDDRNDRAGVGEYSSNAGFWPGEGTVNEAFLGNVAAGGRKVSSGFRFPSSGNKPDAGGTIPFTFVGNEAHSMGYHGIFSWQNAVPSREMVGSRLWRNGIAGIEWGAYGAPFKYFTAQILENGQYGVRATSINTFLQDSVVTGALADGSHTDIGFFLDHHVAAQYPNPAVWLVRNRFADLATFGVSQVEKVVAAGEPCKTGDAAPGPADLALRAVYPGDCSGSYMRQIANSFTQVPVPLFFGDQPNPNSWWQVFAQERDGVADEDFVLVRADQDQLGRQGVLTSQLMLTQSMLPEAVYSAEVDALRIPMDTLPPSIEFSGLLNHRSPDRQSWSLSADFTWRSTVDMPPEISLDVSFEGREATLRAEVGDDIGVERVEFLLDWTLIGTVTEPPYEMVVDLSGHPRKYAYVYARAFDGTRPFDEGPDRHGSDYEQRAYSNVVEVGPEVLHPGSAIPERRQSRVYVPLVER